jgi:beta-fructofuranosidase
MQYNQSKDHQRTAYHFQPPSCWMNDPNGLAQWKGHYHLFYQHNPYGPLNGKMHWGHAMSPDLLHWTHLPVALTPTEGGPDEDGCWSGCLVNNQGTPTLIYSGNARGFQLPCLATSTDDDLLTWHKYPGNPIIPSWPQDLELVEFRDHCVWQEGDQWYQIIGSGIPGVGGTVLLYRSSDLINWEYLQPLCIGNKDESGTMWECPDFFPLGDKYVLIISSIPDGLVYYFIGSYQNFTFTPEQQGILDGSPHFYAPQSIHDEQGRRVLLGWLREDRDTTALQAAGWAGVMSLPRILSLQSDGTLSIEPAAELTHLRLHQRQIAPQLIEGNHIITEQLSSHTLEIILEVEYSLSSHCGLRIQDGSYPDERLQINLQATGLSIEQTGENRTTTSKHCSLEPGRHTLHIFLDGSVMEIFIDNQACLTERFYHSVPQQLSLSVFSNEGEARLHRLDVWNLASVWGQPKRK